MAIHAKRQTIKQVDMQLLRSIWQRINPDSAIGADDGERARQIAVYNAKKAKRIERNKASAMIDLARARRNNNVHELPVGVRNFCLKYCDLRPGEWARR